MKNTATVISTLMLSILHMSSASSLERTPTLESLGPPNYENCVATATNDLNNAIGVCTGVNTTSIEVAWIRIKNSGETLILNPLVPEKSCTALRINYRNKVYGKCVATDGLETPVVWDGTARNTSPLALKPVGQDKSLVVTTVGNELLVGRSFIERDQKGASMVVTWRFDSAAAEPITGIRDSCVPATLVESTTGNNWIALNCQDSTNNTTAKIANKAQNSTRYTITTLAVPDKATHCTLGNTNQSGQTLGTCHFQEGMSRTTYWSTIDGAPTVLKKDPDDKNVSVRLNNTGNALIIYQDKTRYQHDALWNLLQNRIITIAPLPQTAIISTAGLANNNIVLLNTQNAQNIKQGAYLSKSLDTVGIGFFNGGQSSHLEWINDEGTYAVGSAIGGNGKKYAIGFSIPRDDLTMPSGQVSIPPAVAP